MSGWERYDDEGSSRQLNSAPDVTVILVVGHVR